MSNFTATASEFFLIFHNHFALSLFHFLLCSHSPCPLLFFVQPISLLFPSLSVWFSGPKGSSKSKTSLSCRGKSFLLCPLLFPMLIFVPGVSHKMEKVWRRWLAVCLFLKHSGWCFDITVHCINPLCFDLYTHAAARTSREFLPRRGAHFTSNL